MNLKSVMMNTCESLTSQIPYPPGEIWADFDSSAL